MKINLMLLSLFLCATVLQAAGPWAEYAETPPPIGSPAALTGEYVKAAAQRNFDTCRLYMTPEYAQWLESLGGLESALDAFINADLGKRFAWRQSIEGNRATVWVRVHVSNRGREVNVALNLVQTTNGWKLTK
jgi:hypothetical protein